MKLKYYLRGLGIGILLTVIILSITNAGKSNPLTDQEIIQRAEQLGMIMKDDKEEKKKESSKNKEDAEKSETEKIEDDSENMESSKNEEDSEKSEAEKVEEVQDSESEREDPNTDSVAGESDNQSQEEQTSNEEEATGTEFSQTYEGPFLEVEITPGLDAYQISAKLEEAGVIDNATSFRNFLWNKDADIIINSGDYQIPKGITYEDLARMICKSWDAIVQQ